MMNSGFTETIFCTCYNDINSESVKQMLRFLLPFILLVTPAVSKAQANYQVGITPLDSFPGPYLHILLRPTGPLQQMPSYFVLVRAGKPSAPDLVAFSQDPAALRPPDRPFALREQDGRLIVVQHATEAINLFAQLGWELVEIDPDEVSTMYWLKKKT